MFRRFQLSGAVSAIASVGQQLARNTSFYNFEDGPDRPSSARPNFQRVQQRQDAHGGKRTREQIVPPRDGDFTETVQRGPQQYRRQGDSQPPAEGQRREPRQRPDFSNTGSGRGGDQGQGQGQGQGGYQQNQPQHSDQRGRGGGGQGSYSGRGRGGSNYDSRAPPPPPKGSRTQEYMPTKDRLPPRGYNPEDPRRRLAILVDAHKLTVEKFRKVDPLLEEVGAPILFRFFEYELNPAWREYMTERPSFEWFRVERFIPLHLQMAADANHIARYCRVNKIEGIVYLVSETEKFQYQGYFGRLAGQGLNQYVFDEHGLAAQHLEDGREGDGAPK